MGDEDSEAALLPEPGSGPPPRRAAATRPPRSFTVWDMLGKPSRRPFAPSRRTVLAGGVAGAAALGLGARGASADAALDVQLLQTAASIENVLFSTYESILALPLLSAPGTSELREVLSAARNHHGDHRRAFNETVQALGGRAQTAPNPALAQAAGRSRFADLSQIIDLSHELETAAAQTYQSAVGLLTDVNARRLTASILAVEAQHRAVMLVARTLVSANLPDLINIEPGVLARWPADAAAGGTPDAFAPVDEARPPAEGAVR